MQYPEEQHVPSPNYRGVHRLNKDEQGRVKCVACMLCATACPAHCIDIVGATAPATWPDREKYPESFVIDELRCIYCGMCEEACPVEAIELTGLYDLTGLSREQMIFDKTKLLSVFDADQGRRADAVRRAARPSRRRKPRCLPSRWTDRLQAGSAPGDRRPIDVNRRAARTPDLESSPMSTGQSFLPPWSSCWGVRHLPAAAAPARAARPRTVHRRRRGRWRAWACSVFLTFWSPPGPFLAAVFFYLFSIGAIVGGLLTVTSRNPVYSALWFASVVLSTAGLVPAGRAPSSWRPAPSSSTPGRSSSRSCS